MYDSKVLDSFELRTVVSVFIITEFSNIDYAICPLEKCRLLTSGILHVRSRMMERGAEKCSS